jgi:hypothetical protein
VSKWCVCVCVCVLFLDLFQDDSAGADTSSMSVHCVLETPDHHIQFRITLLKVVLHAGLEPDLSTK